MDNSLQNELRQKMRELRDISGYSQKDLADAMEISQPSFFKVQNGDIELAIKHILGCSELFCVTPTEFISLSTEELSTRIRRKSSPTRSSS
jgi:DNA-binding XRE family transcriptional regulator